MLYNRDYNLGLTDEEKEDYKKENGRNYSVKIKSGLAKELSHKLARRCRSLFPNHLVNTSEYEKDDIKIMNENYKEFLKKCKNEREILDYIKQNQYYHIICSLLRGMSLNTGHHGTFLFPEFQLGNSFQVDYLIAAKSSGGYEFVLVELESPTGNITLKDGELGVEFRDGISQLKDWRRWLGNNYSSFSETMKKYKNPELDLPDEFYSLDLSRFYYAVVAGRRIDFKNKTYVISREMKKNENINIFHYDKLYDFAVE